MTSSEKAPLSNAVPLLMAALICDNAVTDPGTGKKSLLGVYSEVHIAQLPATIHASLYFKLTEAEGRYEAQIRYIQVATGETIAVIDGELIAENRLMSGDFVIESLPLPIPTQGRYELQIWMNLMFIGSMFFDVHLGGVKA